MAYDFKAWLKTMPDDGYYNFNECTGNCAMGQFMTYLGEPWSLEKYNEHITKDLGGDRALSANNTFGGLKKMLEVV